MPGGTGGWCEMPSWKRQLLRAFGNLPRASQLQPFSMSLEYMGGPVKPGSIPLDNSKSYRNRWASQVVQGVRIHLQCRRRMFDPWARKNLWRMKQRTPVFMPGESLGQRSLVGYSPWGRKDSDVTEAPEQAHMHTK